MKSPSSTLPVFPDCDGVHILSAGSFGRSPPLFFHRQQSHTVWTVPAPFNGDIVFHIRSMFQPLLPIYERVSTQLKVPRLHPTGGGAQRVKAEPTEHIKGVCDEGEADSPVKDGHACSTLDRKSENTI
jgi:hypothetical protein